MERTSHKIAKMAGRREEGEKKTFQSKRIKHNYTTRMLCAYVGLFVYNLYDHESEVAMCLYML